jgi:hypothetical protein
MQARSFSLVYKPNNLSWLVGPLSLIREFDKFSFESFIIRMGYSPWFWELIRYVHLSRAIAPDSGVLKIIIGPLSLVRELNSIMHVIHSMSHSVWKFAEREDN